MHTSLKVSKLHLIFKGFPMYLLSAKIISKVLYFSKDFCVFLSLQIAMNNLKVQLRDILEAIAKAKGLELLRSLKSPKRWSELREVAKGDNKSLTNRMNEFIELGLVEPVLLRDSPKGSKAYVLTDFGRFVLKKLEEIERYQER